MSEFVLYMAPGTCARVPTIALEEAGQDFKSVVVRFMKAEHKSPAFKKLNPNGKVPTLVVDGEPLTENVAILTYLNQRFPQAQLLPKASNELIKARQIADLAFCSATLHPIVTRIRMPQLIAPEIATKGVHLKACEAMDEYFMWINKKLAEAKWWYGDDWSVVDAYLYWIYWRVAGAGYNIDPYPNLQTHAARMEDRPSTQRAMAREAAAEAQLEAEGLAFRPPPLGKDG